MNQRVAKVIRREVFGDKSRRAGGYTVIPFYKKITRWIKGKKENITLKTGQLVCTGLREKYKKVKKEFKARHRVIAGAKYITTPKMKYNARKRARYLEECEQGKHHPLYRVEARKQRQANPLHQGR